MDDLDAALDAWLLTAERGRWPDPDELLDAAPADDPEWRSAILRLARERIDALPAPIHPRVSTPLARRRRALAFLLASLDEAAADSTQLSQIAREIWLSGAGDAAYVRALLDMGERGLAQSIARLLLGEELFEGDDELADALRESLRLPPGFEKAATKLARSPSEEGWCALMRFGDDEGGRRPEHALSILAREGVDAETRFVLASLEGPGALVHGLVQSGEVDPRLIEAHARAATDEERPEWLSLAAEAAAARGDDMTTIRLFRELEGGLAAGARAELLERLQAVASGNVAETLTRVTRPSSPPRA
ncbi:MAG: hypothetical protein GXP55_24375 [Deltaproteobacteria bacterium]|nr:hypothetical protein [Deltaproteobacteria bacterium]